LLQFAGRSKGLNAKRYFSHLTRRVICNRLVYKIYEKTLWNQLKDGDKPEHIGIILDGNRRWELEQTSSKDSSPSFEIGHRAGADKVEELLRWCLALDIRTITIYSFSTENFHRPKEEVENILGLLNQRLEKVKTSKDIHENRVCIRALGRLSLLPQRTQQLIKEVEEATKDYDEHYLNIAVAYGGRAEMIDAMKKIAVEVKNDTLGVDDIDEHVVEDNLYTSHLPKPEPDLIIRTSGEERLSGFLLWQAAYSELCFMDVYWPDFRQIDLLRAVRTYQQRERRFGT
jgi:tritrans,polycis-undecaprenyl-diphosphate synthase [geranylgeranyl-diphosphate specific]